MPFTFNSLRLPKQARPCDGPIDYPNASSTSLADKRLLSALPLTRTKSFLSRLGLSSSETRGDLQAKRESANPSPSEKQVHRQDRSATPSFRPSRASIISLPLPLNIFSGILVESDLETRAINSMQLSRSAWRRERIEAWRMSSASLSAPYPDEDGLTPFKDLDPSPAQRPSSPPVQDNDKDKEKLTTLAALYEPADALLKCLAVEPEKPTENTPPRPLNETVKLEVEVHLEIFINEPVACAKNSSQPASPAVHLTIHKPTEPPVSTGANVRPLATARKRSRQRRIGGGPSKNRYLTQLVARSTSRIRSKRASVQDRGEDFDCPLTPPESTLIVYHPLNTESCISINIEADEFWTKTTNTEDNTNRTRKTSSASVIHDAFKETLPGFYEPLTTSVCNPPSSLSSLRNTSKSSQMTADFFTVASCYVDCD